MNEANYFIFHCSSSKKIIWCLYFVPQVPQEADEWYYTQKKDTKGENPKNISVCEIHYSKYQLIKSMYKIITSLFLQKSPEASQFKHTAKLKVLKKSTL